MWHLGGSKCFWRKRRWIAIPCPLPESVRKLSLHYVPTDETHLEDEQIVNQLKLSPHLQKLFISVAISKNTLSQLTLVENYCSANGVEFEVEMY